MKKHTGKLVLLLLTICFPSGTAWAEDEGRLEDVGGGLEAALTESFGPDVARSEDRPATESPQAKKKPATEKPAAPQAAKQPWLDSLAAGRRDAQQAKRPMLVRFGAEWCASCVQLEQELADAALAIELSRWTLVYLDVEKATAEARQLDAEVVPALRLLTSSGQLVASHDGFLDAKQLAAWLAENYERAVHSPPVVLVADNEPNSFEVAQLVAKLRARDVAEREAAMRRLADNPDVAREATVAAFVKGKLATRLATLEVLSRWNAPTDLLDPWRPETLTQPRLRQLETWAGEAPPREAKMRPLSEEELADVRAEIDKLLTASEDDAAAICNRLAHHGEALLPEVYGRLKEADADAARERLGALRYHLVASRGLVLSWPDGLSALASSDLAERRRAADLLVERARPHDEPLLLELFSDPDPLVREISLRGLHDLGGKQASKALVRLLDDPEPNVRAAVLKQLTEAPSASMIAPVTEYLKSEQDADLVVHAARFLRATNHGAAVETLLTLLDHKSWRVRAEAAEAISEAVGSHQIQQFSEGKNKAFDALFKLLEDEDGFVIAQALKGVSKAHEPPVDALSQVMLEHPELTLQVVEVMASAPGARRSALPHLRKLARHESPEARVAALAGLLQVAPDAMEEELIAGLQDEASDVRIQAATVLFQLFEQQRATSNNPSLRFNGQFVDLNGESHVFVANEPSPGIFGMIRDLFGGGSGQRPQEVEAAKPAEKKAEPPVQQDADKVAADSGPGDKSAPDEQETDKAPASEEAAPEMEVWLAEFRAGKGRPEWLELSAKPLEAMLAADSTEERVRAALCLLPLGRDAEALDVLRTATNGDRRMIGHAFAALAWLPWEARLALFHDLMALNPEPDQLAQLSASLNTIRNPKAIEPVWILFAGDDVNGPLASGLLNALRQAYFHENWYDTSSAPLTTRRRATADARRWIETGSEWQKAAGLAILISVSLDEAEQTARAILKDETADEAFRDDALRIVLASGTKSKSRKTAIEMLSDENLRLRKTALAFLAMGESAVGAIRDGQIDLIYQGKGYRFTSSRSGQVIRSEPPRGLKPETLRPMLDDSDAQVAAYAGYLLVLLDEPDGLEPLLAYWRALKDEPYDLPWTRMLYRAIAYGNDSAHVPILREIYGQFGTDDHRVQDFYWTIRSMSGSPVLKLRKQIRREVGMDNLQ